ncbi:hypothetical protein FJNA_11870 [Thermus sp. FJN-A]
MRKRLFLTLLLAFLPALLVLAWGAYRDFREEEARAKEEVRRLATLARGAVEEVLERGFTALESAAAAPEVRGDPATCSAFLARLLPAFPDLANLGRVDADGLIRCSAVPLSSPVKPWASWYPEALARGQAASGYTLGGIVGRPVLVLARRLGDQVVFASWDLEALDRLARSLPLPAGGVLTVVDREGRVLFRSLEGTAWRGAQVYQDPALGRTGVARLRGLDQEERLYALLPLTASGMEIGQLRLGFPLSLAHAQAKAHLWQSLALLLTAFFFLFLLAGLLLERGVLARMRALMEAVERLGRGDLSARTGLQGEDELARFGQALDQTVAALALAQAELKARALLQEALLEGGEEGILAEDALGHRVFANRAFYRLLDLPEGAGREAVLEQLLDPERFLALGEGEARVPLKNGRVLLCLRRRLDGGRLVVSFLRDLTPLLRAEDTLRQQTARLQALLENLQEVVYQVAVSADPLKSHLVYVSPQVEDLLGYPPRAFLADPGLWWERLHPEDRPQVAASTAKALEEGQAVRLYRFGRPDGRFVWLEDRVTYRPEMQSLFGSARDVTQEVALREALAESEARFRALAENMEAGLVLGDPATGKVVYANPAFLRLTGFSREEVVGLDALLKAHPEDRERALARRQALERGEAVEPGFEVRILTPRGVRWVRLVSHHVRIEGKPLVLATVLDVTERKELELALEARVAERTKDLETFAQGVAHDLRAPLRQIEGLAQALLEDFPLPPEAKDYLEALKRAAETLDRRTEALLDYARLAQKDLALAPVNLEEALKEAALPYQGKALRVEGPLPLVLGHKEALVQVLANLLDNAFKFRAPDREPEVRVFAEEAGEWVRVHVADNGPGIPEPDLERIFHPLVRLEGVGTRPGMGLGLALVRRAVEKMGGRVYARSTPGQGSEFLLELRPAPGYNAPDAHPPFGGGRPQRPSS